MGTPALIGPHTFNFEEATQQAIVRGAALRVTDADTLFSEARRLLADGASRAQMGAAGHLFWRQNQGAAERTVAALAPLVNDDASATIPL